MENKKPRDPLYPQGFKDIKEIPKVTTELPRPKQKEEESLGIIEKFNNRLGKMMTNSGDIEEEDKKKIGMIIITIIILTLVVSAYYFLIYEPAQEELQLAKTTKLNELHELYTGALATSSSQMMLENKINDANSVQEVESINILTTATSDWKNFQKQSINANKDQYNRTMAVYSNESKDVMMSVNDAITIVNENTAEVLSTIRFEKPNTVSVPILLSRLQAGAGLITVGSIVDVYTQNNYTFEDNDTSNNNTVIKGCTVLAIMRYEKNGDIDSEYAKGTNTVLGNNTNPTENSKTFTSNVLELIKGAIIQGYDETETADLLKNYGIKLSNYERQINLADLDAEYMLLIEAPQDKVNFILDNMDDIVLTIPTANAPSWMVGEINSTY